MEQILIVEDDSFLNKMLDYNLTADGYGVTSALNARTAAEAIRQREFDLVLLDINLPDGNGFELCKLIKPTHRTPSLTTHQAATRYTGSPISAPGRSPDRWRSGILRWCPGAGALSACTVQNRSRPAG